MSSEDRGNSARPTILIVDDTDVGRDLIGGVLQREGYQLAFADNGQQALSVATRVRPDVILLDVMMPGLDGFEVCRVLRRDPVLGKVPIVMITALDDRASRLRGFEVGADDFVTKPFDRRELKMRVRTIVRLNRFRELLEEHGRLERLIQVSPYGVGVVRGDGVIEIANSVLAQILGAPDSRELIGSSIHDFWPLRGAHPDDSWLSWVLESDDPVRTEAELNRLDGTRVPVELAAARVEWDDDYRAQIVISDISERKRVEEQLLRGVFFDRLTGLPNRTLFLDRVEQALLRSSGEGEAVGILFFDIDHFRSINESLGHSMGDQLLVAVGRRLSQFLGTHTTLARISGDEFAILRANPGSSHELMQLAERLLRQLDLPFRLGDEELRLSISCGVVIGKGEDYRAEEMLRDADTALYMAKSQGRAKSVVFDNSMRERAVGFMRLANDLRAALQRDELYLAYQPIFALEDRRVVALEALLRWRHPQHGAMSPAEYIAVAEETGLIHTLGHWILKSAIAAMKIWLDDGLIPREVKLHVNISARQLTREDFVGTIEEALRSVGLPAELLQLELTESAIMDNPEASARVFGELNAMGIGLSIDDFGTGYSSFSYLSRMPLESLKIDRSFTMRLGSDERELEIVKTIVQLGQNLGLATIAEGVETERQARLLRSVGCDAAQGFLYARPLPDDEVRQLFRERQSKSARS
ncbi:MAG: EAL domain-containing protein [Myxococcales bacterium]|nr:EAL domain-containing protein [Myxococcales bacterium]